MLHDGAKIDSPSRPPEMPHRAVQMEAEDKIVIAFDEPEVGPPQTLLLDDLVYNLPSYIFYITTGFQQFLSWRDRIL